MKHILFMLLALTSWGARAQYSPADCARALAGDTTLRTSLNAWSRVDGDLTGSAKSTVLIRLPRGRTTLDLPVGSGVRNLFELGFTRDGLKYEVVHGTNDQIAAARAYVAAANGGRRLRYRVLDRDDETAPAAAPTLGHELHRAVPGAAWLKIPFVKLAAWLGRFGTYRYFADPIAEWAAPKAARLATKLHAVLNPRPAPLPRSTTHELRKFIAPDIVGPVDPRENMLSKRLFAFFDEEVKITSITQPGSLAVITYELLDVLNSELRDETRLAIGRTGAQNWDFKHTARAERLEKLKAAWLLIDERTWGQSDRPNAFTMFEIERTIARYRERKAIAASRAPASIPLAELGKFLVFNYGLAADRLRDRLALAIVRGQGDQSWVMVPHDFMQNSIYRKTIRGAADLRAHLEKISGRRISPKVAMHLEQLYDDPNQLPELPWMDVAQNPTHARSLYRSQSVLLVRPTTVFLPKYWMVPLAAPPTVRFDVDGVAAPADLASRVLPYLYGNHERALPTEDGRLRLIDTSAAGDTHVITYSVEYPANEPPLVWVTGFEPIASRDQARFWHDLANYLKTSKIEVRFEAEPMHLAGRAIRTVRMPPAASIEAAMKFGVQPDAVIKVLSAMEGAAIDPERRRVVVTVEGARYEVRFGSILNWARVKSIRPVPADEAP